MQALATFSQQHFTACILRQGLSPNASLTGPPSAEGAASAPLPARVNGARSGFTQSLPSLSHRSASPSGRCSTSE
jgi:hypothetical protein